MIYHLFQLLKEYDIPGQGLMNYLSFRAFLASATAMLFSLLVGKKIISLLQRKQIGETVRDLGDEFLPPIEQDEFHLRHDPVS